MSNDLLQTGISVGLTFNTGLDFSAMDLRSSIPALTATEVRAEGAAGAKAAAEPIKRERRASFMVKVDKY